MLTIPYEFEKWVGVFMHLCVRSPVLFRYKQFSLQFYTILMSHADDLQAVSVDEALIEVTSSIARIRAELVEGADAADETNDPAQDFAEAIRSQVRKATNCEGKSTDVVYRRSLKHLHVQ